MSAFFQRNYSAEQPVEEPQGSETQNIEVRCGRSSLMAGEEKWHVVQETREQNRMWKEALEEISETKFNTRIVFLGKLFLGKLLLVTLSLRFHPLSVIPTYHHHVCPAILARAWRTRDVS